MSKGDEIDELVSSVRNFVAHKEMSRMVAPTPADKLVLTAETRLTDEQVKAIDAEWAAELRALEAAGIVPPGKALELSMEDLEEAIAKLPDNWQDDQPEPTFEHVDNAFAADLTDDANASQPAEAVGIDMAAIENMIASKMDDLTDNDALRSMIVKVVHEELNGELGERITRNVRKLVRREINRIMTSRDLTGD